MKSSVQSLILRLLVIAAFLGSSGCLPEPPAVVAPAGFTQSDLTPEAPAQEQAPQTNPTEPFPTRPPFPPGELVDYTAQTGDTVAALAARFNTTVEEIMAANPIIPVSATTMPPGMPMKIPIYYRPLWGNPYQIIPDSLFVYGPAQRGFSAAEFASRSPGWLKNETAFAGGDTLKGGAIIDFVAEEYSVSPRLLLAISEYLTGALTQTQPPNPGDPYLLGKADFRKEGYYRQLAWVADRLNLHYYRWRDGELLEITLSDGRLERPDPWQNAATVALQAYFSETLPAGPYRQAISSEGLAKTYRSLFGDPWANVEPHIPGSLQQPDFNLPFEPGKIWAYTGGPHSAWGEELSPLSAIDFAPPSLGKGCLSSPEWATAVAGGILSRTDFGIAVLDLDGDGDERTGWVVFYLHLETPSIPPAGTYLNAGDRIGHPSCDGGVSTGTHIHIARKYNGEWMQAGGIIPYNFEGWVVRAGSIPYQGTMSRNGKMIRACTCSDSASHIQSQPLIVQP